MTLPVNINVERGEHVHEGVWSWTHDEDCRMVNDDHSDACARRSAALMSLIQRHRDEAAAAVRAKQAAEVERLRAERDAAIAHDRQPYPTAWAYEQACRALGERHAEVERLRAALAFLWRRFWHLYGAKDGPALYHIEHALFCGCGDDQHDFHNTEARAALAATTVAPAPAATGSPRVQEIREQQSSGGGPVTAVMVSRSDEAPAPAATERCAGCGHETRFHADGQCDCEGDGEAGLCPCPEPRP